MTKTTEKTTNNSWSTAGALGTLDLYKHYKKNCDDPLPKKEWKAVLDELNREFMRMVVEEGKNIKMPYLGKLSVRKYKPTNDTSIDFGHYNKTGEKRYFTNEHSDGYKARFHWAKTECRIPGKAPYSINITRKNSRAIPVEMRKFNGHAKYLEYNGKPKYYHKAASKGDNS